MKICIENINIKGRTNNAHMTQIENLILEKYLSVKLFNDIKASLKQ